MEKLIKTIVVGLVENTDAVEIIKDPVREDGTAVYHVNVASEDMGRIIGKQGRIAKAIRTVARSGANRTGEKIIIEID